MPRYTFEEVVLRETRRWKDPITGKTRQKTKKFSQTLNPFNKNGQGEVKTREEIRAELRVQADAWLAEAV